MLALSSLCIVSIFYLCLFLPCKRKLEKENVAKPSVLAGELGKRKGPEIRLQSVQLDLLWLLFKKTGMMVLQYNVLNAFIIVYRLPSFIL